MNVFLPTSINAYFFLILHTTTNANKKSKAECVCDSCTKEEGGKNAAAQIYLYVRTSSFVDVD